MDEIIHKNRDQRREIKSKKIQLYEGKSESKVPYFIAAK